MVPRRLVESGDDVGQDGAPFGERHDHIVAEPAAAELVEVGPVRHSEELTRMETGIRSWLASALTTAFTLSGYLAANLKTCLEALAVSPT